MPSRAQGAGGRTRQAPPARTFVGGFRSRPRGVRPDERGDTVPREAGEPTDAHGRQAAAHEELVHLGPGHVRERGHVAHVHERVPQDVLDGTGTPERCGGRRTSWRYLRASTGAAASRPFSPTPCQSTVDMPDTFVISQPRARHFRTSPRRANLLAHRGKRGTSPCQRWPDGESPKDAPRPRPLAKRYCLRLPDRTEHTSP